MLYSRAEKSVLLLSWHSYCTCMHALYMEYYKRYRMNWNSWRVNGFQHLRQLCVKFACVQLPIYAPNVGLVCYLFGVLFFHRERKSAMKTPCVICFTSLVGSICVLCAVRTLHTEWARYGLATIHRTITMHIKYHPTTEKMEFEKDYRVKSRMWWSDVNIKNFL